MSSTKKTESGRLEKILAKAKPDESDIEYFLSLYEECVTRLSRQGYKAMNWSLDREELEQELRLKLFLMLKDSFKRLPKTKKDLDSFVYRNLKNRMISLIRHYNRKGAKANGVYKIDEKVEEELQEELQLCLLPEDFTDMERKIIYLYMLGENQTEIANRIGVTQQAVSFKLKGIKQSLRDLLFSKEVM